MNNGSRFAVRSLVEDPGTKEEMATHTNWGHTGGQSDGTWTDHGATKTGPTLGEEETLPTLWADGGVMTMGTGNCGRSRTQQRLPLRPVQRKTSQTART